MYVPTNRHIYNGTPLIVFVQKNKVDKIFDARCVVWGCINGRELGGLVGCTPSSFSALLYAKNSSSYAPNRKKTRADT